MSEKPFERGKILRVINEGIRTNRKLEELTLSFTPLSWPFNENKNADFIISCVEYIHFFKKF